MRIKAPILVDPDDAMWRVALDGSWIAVALSPDARTLICRRRDDYVGGGTWSADLGGGGEPRKIADEVGWFLWSADGKRLVFTEVGDQGRSHKTWRMNADGTGRVALGVPETERVVDWSADGRWFLTFSGADAPRGEPVRSGPLRLMRTDGGDSRLVTDEAFPATFPRLAPDGRSVVFAHHSPGKLDWTLWMVDADGKNRRPFLTERDGEMAVQAVWSPDGKRLAVLSIDSVAGPDGSPRPSLPLAQHLDVADADGKRRRRLPVLEDLIYTLCDWR
jgi:Tol biopolymer transport system component